MPSGLKNKTVILHATTTTKVKNRPHQKTITHPHAPPQLPVENAELLYESEVIIRPPLPCFPHLEINLIQVFLLPRREVYQSTKKKDIYD